MLNLHGYGMRLVEGALVTVELAALSLIIAVLLGLVTASAKLSKRRLPHLLATLYTTLIRGVPDLVLMMLFFFGGQMLMNDVSDWLYARFGLDLFFNIDAFIAGVLTIGLIFGAYMGETFRGAIQAVDKGQVEAATACGMRRALIFRRIRFPLMMRHALPGLSNNWLVLLKTTALVSVIGLSDMVRVATQASKTTLEPFTFMLFVAVIYLLLTSLSEWVFKRLTRKYNAGFTGGRS
ncbi:MULTISPECIES: ABC transporter permease [unclassified Halomonas]|uniref:ABC transporter permease n=1 Tax=Halomonas sp. N3-2A TaxID=2014541 RepID=UPI000B5B3D34|nr:MULTISPECIES: ABC transporter permease [unclassified Halomonas]ASK20051.1 ABC transporter [Halomonas sp. N3-2A]UTD57413.1 ABC transporter permease [Halomonas sp. MS1]